jgi:acyl-coenzyme A synthetase/AMP-(fatty) acid ligase
LSLSVLLLSCGPPEAGEAARRAEARAAELFAALASADLETLRALGPAFEDIDAEAVENLRRQLTSHLSWEVGEAEVSGRRARVPVSLTPRPGSDSDTPARAEQEITVPLRWRSGRWEVQSSLSVTRTIDIVPLEE